jgi:hypothetical protein
LWIVGGPQSFSQAEKSFHTVALDSSHEISWSVEVYEQVR